MDRDSTFSDVHTADIGLEETEQLPTIDQIDNRVTLADYIYPAIQKQYIAILTHEADVIADGDVEALHQMRVSLRRLRSTIQAFAPILDIPKVMGEKQIGKIAKILGKVRDLDVLQATCKDLHIELPDSERSILDEIAIKIGKRRRKGILKVQSILVDRDYRCFKLAINNWLNHPQYTQTIDIQIESILPDLLISVVGKLFLNPGWWIETEPTVSPHPEAAVSVLSILHGTKLHSLRKQVKATRYLMELFPDRYSPRYNDHLKDLQQIHKLLGNIQDGVVLDNFIQRILGKRAASKLPTLYTEIERERYVNWQKWQPIQSRYQELAVRKELQLLLIQDIVTHNS